jgi:hypothetical protein
MMSHFVTELDVHLINNSADSGRGLWMLDTDLIYYSSLLKQRILVPAGFHTDFASVPRLPVVFLLCGDTSKEAAVVHDWLYTSKITTRRMSDAILREAGKVSGVPMWRRWMIWAGVRVFGGGPWGGKGWI